MARIFFRDLPDSKTASHPHELEGNHVLLGYSGSMASRATWLYHDGELQRFAFEPTLCTSSTVGLIRVALAGSGILLYGPHFMIGDALERGDLVEILEDWKQPDTIVHAVIATESRQRRAVSGFLEFMKSRWCSQPGFLEAAHTFGKTEQGQIAFEGCNVLVEFTRVVLYSCFYAEAQHTNRRDSAENTSTDRRSVCAGEP